MVTARCWSQAALEGEICMTVLPATQNSRRRVMHEQWPHLENTPHAHGMDMPSIPWATWGQNPSSPLLCGLGLDGRVEGGRPGVRFALGFDGFG